MIIRRRKVHSYSIIYQFLSVFVCAGEGPILRSQELFLCAALKLSLLKISLEKCLAAFHLAKRSVAAGVTRTYQRARLRFPIIFFNFILPSDRREAWSYQHGNHPEQVGEKSCEFKFSAQRDLDTRSGRSSKIFHKHKFEASLGRDLLQMPNAKLFPCEVW